MSSEEEDLPVSIKNTGCLLMLIIFIPSDEEHDLQEDESGTQQKGGMRASYRYRHRVGHWSFRREKAPSLHYRTC